MLIDSGGRAEYNGRTLDENPARAGIVESVDTGENRNKLNCRKADNEKNFPSTAESQSMNRRHFLQLGVGVTMLGLSGCLNGNPPELRVKNISENAQTIHIRVSQQDEELLSRSFSVPSKADGEEQGTVEDVYPGAGTYTITGEIAGGVTKTEEIKLAEESRMLTHVMVNSDETLSVGRMSL